MNLPRCVIFFFAIATLSPTSFATQTPDNSNEEDCRTKIMNFCLETLEHTEEECQEQVPLWCDGTSSYPNGAAVMTVEVDLDCYAEKMDHCINNMKNSQEDCVDKVEEWCAPQVQLEFDHEDDCQVHKLQYCLESLKLTQEVCEQKIAHWCARSPELCVERKIAWCLEHQHQSKEDCQKLAEIWCLPGVP